MKALVLWQPWASAMALRLKRNETRGVRWTTLKGDVAICAAKRPLDQTGLDLARRYEIPLVDMPFGAVVCVVSMVDAKPSDTYDMTKVCEMELALGDYSPGRWIYHTGMCMQLEHPVPVIGRQGVFNLPPDVEARVRAELPIC